MRGLAGQLALAFDLSCFLLPRTRPLARAYTYLPTTYYLLKAALPACLPWRALAQETMLGVLRGCVFLHARQVVHRRAGLAAAAAAAALAAVVVAAFCRCAANSPGERSRRELVHKAGEGAGLCTPACMPLSC